VILAGIATPTDAGAVGCVATFILTTLSGRLTVAKVKHSIRSTLEISSMILMLVAASNLFGSIFARLGSAEFIANLVTSLQLPPMDHAGADPAHHLPARLAAGVGADRADRGADLPAHREGGRHRSDLVCTLVAVTLQTAWLSPPVALSAYFLKGVVPEWRIQDIIALSFRISGLTLSLKPASSKSFIQRSGVISG
jgi:TRAP-type mannitol/chloroaromatic compound transport system permease large subunit